MGSETLKSSSDIKLTSVVCEYKFISRLKTSGDSSVYIAKREHDAKYKIAKVYNIDVLNFQELELIKSEILTLRNLKHPNIQEINSVLTSGKYLYMFFPFMPYGSCKDVSNIVFKTGFPETLLALIIQNVLHGLIYLHRQGIIHRSICAGHILLNQSKAVLCGLRNCVSKLSHGKYTKKFHCLETSNSKNLNWLAPELIEQNILGYNELSDIYSLGITCCELANGVEPFCNVQPTFMLTEKLRGNVPILLDRSTCPDHEVFITSKKLSTVSSSPGKYKLKTFSDDFHQFIEICMKKRALERWTATQLLSHSFFKQTRNTNICKEFHLSGVELPQIFDATKNAQSNEDDEQNGTDWAWSF